MDFYDHGSLWENLQKNFYLIFEKIIFLFFWYKKILGNFLRKTGPRGKQLEKAEPSKKLSNIYSFLGNVKIIMKNNIKNFGKEK